MPGTATYSWTKPALTDLPNGPAQIGLLADQVDLTLSSFRPVTKQLVTDAPYDQVNTWVDYLSASWPALTLTVGPSGIVEVSVSAYIQNTSTTTSTVHCTWRASGAKVLGHGTDQGITVSGGILNASKTFILRGCTVGAVLSLTPGWRISSGSSATATTSVGYLNAKNVP